MSALVPLSHGKFAIVDEADLPLLAGFNWKYLKRADGRGGYAIACPKDESGKKRMLSMHRLLLQPPAGLHVDHINGDGIDNRRANIRLCTQSQNAANRAHRGKYRGVSVRGKQFYAVIWCESISYTSGPHCDEISAARAYDAASEILHGEFGRKNFPDLPAVELSRVSVGGYGQAKPHPAFAAFCKPPKPHWRDSWDAYRAKLKLAEDDRKRAVSAVARANRPLLANFKPRDAEIIAAFACGATGRELAKKHGLTHQRIHQMFAKAKLVGVVRAPRGPIRVDRTLAEAA